MQRAQLPDFADKIDNISRLAVQIYQKSCEVDPGCPSSSFLEFLYQFIQIYTDKKVQIEKLLDSIKNALRKFSQLKAILDNTKRELATLKPLLQSVTADSKMMEELIIKNTKKVKEFARIVRQDQLTATAKNNESTQLLEDAQKAQEEFDKVAPVLNAALAGIRSVSKADIEELAILYNRYEFMYVSNNVSAHTLQRGL